MPGRSCASAPTATSKPATCEAPSRRSTLPGGRRRRRCRHLSTAAKQFRHACACAVSVSACPPPCAHRRRSRCPQHAAAAVADAAVGGDLHGPLPGPAVVRAVPKCTVVRCAMSAVLRVHLLPVGSALPWCEICCAMRVSALPALHGQACCPRCLATPLGRWAGETNCSAFLSTFMGLTPVQASSCCWRRRLRRVHARHGTAAEGAAPASAATLGATGPCHATNHTS